MKAASRRYSLDANVVLRYVLNDEPTLAAQAATIMESVADGDVAGYLDPVILAEIVHVLTRAYHMPPDEISELLLPLVRDEGIVVPDKDRYIDALTLLATGVPHFGDACACAMALLQCDGRLLSFDRKLSRVPGVHRLETV